jgi:hypothetical protein
MYQRRTDNDKRKETPDGPAFSKGRRDHPANATLEPKWSIDAALLKSMVGFACWGQIAERTAPSVCSSKRTVEWGQEILVFADGE